MANIIGTPDDDKNLLEDGDHRLLLGTHNNDKILGLAGDDIINGMGGYDLVLGGVGNDTIYDTDGNDKLLGGQGHDLVQGGNGDDILLGGQGNDRLWGQRGEDTLVGGAGQDQFYPTSPLDLKEIEPFSKAKVDAFRDFSVAEDRIVVTRAGFGDLARGVLNASRFVIGSAAADRSDRFIYDPLSGILSFDPDGLGGLDQFRLAKLPTGLQMTHRQIGVE